MGMLALKADERVKDVSCSEEMLRVHLIDGRIISVPLLWYPRLFHATPESGIVGKCVGLDMGFIGLRLMRI